MIGLLKLIARHSAMKLAKKGTSLVKLILSRRKSGLLQYRLSIPVLLGKYFAQIHLDRASN
jgi:hypothetical protein